MSTDSVREPVLRPASVDDVDVIAEIWHSGWRDGHLGHVPDTLLQYRTPADFLHRTPGQLPFTTVAVLDELVGFVTVRDDEVEQVYVAPQARGKGVAGALLEHAESLVAERYDRVWLAVAGGNARARRFYERSGWVDAGHLDYEAATGDGATATVPCRRYEKDLKARQR